MVVAVVAPQCHPKPYAHAQFDRTAAMSPARTRRRTVAAVILGFLVVASACAPAPSPPPASPTQVVIQGGLDSNSPQDGSQPTPTWTAVPSLPGALTAFPTSAPGQALVLAPPPYPAPWSVLPSDHFYFARPIPSGYAYHINAEYRYGNTDSGNEPTHTGVDMVADRGTPVVAAGDGTVVWAGYGLYRGIYDVSDPYGLAVAIRHDFGYQGQTLWTVYAHLNRVDVWLGQHVSTGEQLGVVGMTGHASGPHLHFEVRLGDNRYFNTRDPELWVVSPQGWGVLAGKMLDSFGKPLDEQSVEITSRKTGDKVDVQTYAPDTVHSDEVYQEDFVVSDLPEGVYQVDINYAGHLYSTELYVYPGMTNMVYFRGRQGFLPPPSSAPMSAQPPSS
jgi:murein DD-endopeptidase MepM/ murein hydrolase activator NlpD